MIDNQYLDLINSKYIDLTNVGPVAIYDLLPITVFERLFRDIIIDCIDIFFLNEKSTHILLLYLQINYLLSQYQVCSFWASIYTGNVDDTDLVSIEAKNFIVVCP